ncbi:MAG TPA: two-component regulator propeller domain-containing protein, partial [Cyclobacteriaceae bacterium]|nr:two-component regulator propeller domain-containing protein [Cyclobacteriaceae bacterium]
MENGLSQNSVYRIYQDKKGFMWFGTADGLNRYDGENIRVFKSINPTLTRANSNFIRGWLCEDKQGRIWFANETGIYFFNPIKEQVEQAYDFLTDTQSGFVYYTA